MGTITVVVIFTDNQAAPPRAEAPRPECPLSRRMPGIYASS